MEITAADPARRRGRELGGRFALTPQERFSADINQ
jgi:hypothetical protein